MDASGLHECFNRALSYIRGDGVNKLVGFGFGCDGARVNLSERSLRGQIDYGSLQSGVLSVRIRGGGTIVLT